MPGRQNAADDPFLDGELQPLRKAHRQGAALLDGLKIVVRYCAAAKRAGEPVGGGNRILHRHYLFPRRRSATSHRFGLAMHLLLVEWRGWTAQMINFLTGIALASPLASAQRPMGHVF